MRESIVYFNDGGTYQRRSRSGLITTVRKGNRKRSGFWQRDPREISRPWNLTDPVLPQDISKMHPTSLVARTGLVGATAGLLFLAARKR